MYPEMAEEKRTPTLVAVRSPLAGTEGVDPRPKSVSEFTGSVTLTVTPVDGGPRLTVSSTARLMIVTGPVAPGVQAKVQLLVPTAGFHVCPPSVETSTPTTNAPAAALAVPVIVIGVPLGNEAPDGGQVMTETGGVLLRGIAAARGQPSLQRSRLDPHVGEEVHRRLLHVGVGIGQVVDAVVICKKGPRTMLHRTDA